MMSAHGFGIQKPAIGVPWFPEICPAGRRPGVVHWFQLLLWGAVQDIVFHKVVEYDLNMYAWPAVNFDLAILLQSPE